MGQKSKAYGYGDGNQKNALGNGYINQPSLKVTKKGTTKTEHFNGKSEKDRLNGCDANPGHEGK